MSNLLNKTLIILALSGILLMEYTPYQGIIAITITIAISGLLEYFNNEKLDMVLFIMYTILSGFYPQLFIYLPLVSYDLLKTKYQLLALSAVIPYSVHFDVFSLGTNSAILVISLMVYLLKVQAINEQTLRKDYINQRDYLTELSISLENKNNELINNQDLEVHLATLNERNRIAREIHDNVGHLLSSSILQIGAIMTLSKEMSTVKNLEVVKNTLNEGMNSIRQSVHDLHDESIDLYAEINNILRNFTFCKVKLNYEISGELTAKVKYAILAIIKEALSNVIKHSNGDYVSVSLYEHPKLFQLIIFDNGTKTVDLDNTRGMGLENIKQRVTTLKGNINFDQSKGFKIFISFMKT